MQAFERLDVYRVAAEFDEVMGEALRGLDTADALQLDRAAGSVLNNIAEAATHPTGGNKTRVYRIALAEAAECLSLLNRLSRKGHISRLTYNRARSLIERVLKMLRRLAPPVNVRR